MKSTTTYLHFSGDGRAALSFYRECFGGELSIMAYPDASGQPDTAPEALVQHGVITLDGRSLLMASDHPQGLGDAGQGGRFSVFIDCSSAVELDRVFASLSRGGEVAVPPCDMPTGRFAMCSDSFGIPWILSATTSV